MKKLLVPLCILCVLLSLRAGFSRDKEKIIRMVNENYSLLEECIANDDFSRVEWFWLIEDITKSDSAVEFFCNGWGLAPASRYQGFYYSWNDDTAAIWCGQPLDVMTPSGSGWLWEESNGDNGYYTEHICGHFWYYEAWF